MKFDNTFLTEVLIVLSKFDKAFPSYSSKTIDQLKYSRLIKYASILVCCNSTQDIRQISMHAKFHPNRTKGSRVILWKPSNTLWKPSVTDEQTDEAHYHSFSTKVAEPKNIIEEV
jgi:hypothetical protein